MTERESVRLALTTFFRNVRVFATIIVASFVITTTWVTVFPDRPGIEASAGVFMGY